MPTAHGYGYIHGYLFQSYPIKFRRIAILSGCFLRGYPVDVFCQLRDCRGFFYRRQFQDCPEDVLAQDNLSGHMSVHPFCGHAYFVRNFVRYAGCRSSHPRGDHLRGVFYLNPMAGIIDAFRWSILGHEIVMFWPGYMMSLGISMGVLFLGVLFSVHYEPKVIDIL
jgi:hypothetical protein